MRGLLTFAVVMILGGVVAQGHHSIAAAYDRDRPVKLDGIVVEFAMVQPHPFLVVEVKDGRDTVRWRGELDNRQELVAIGMTAETLKPGDRLISVAAPAERSHDPSTCAGSIGLRMGSGTSRSV